MMFEDMGFCRFLLYFVGLTLMKFFWDCLYFCFLFADLLFFVDWEINYLELGFIHHICILNQCGVEKLEKNHVIDVGYCFMGWWTLMYIHRRNVSFSILTSSNPWPTLTPHPKNSFGRRIPLRVSFVPFCLILNPRPLRPVICFFCSEFYGFSFQVCYS